MARRMLNQPAIGGLLLLFFCLTLYQTYIANLRGIINTKRLDINRLPKEYTTKITQPEHCEAQFGRDFFGNFQRNTADYCDRQSTSQMTCFSNNNDSSSRVDTFCIGGPAVFDPDVKRFCLSCDLEPTPPASQVAEPGPVRLRQLQLSQLEDYWYQTGPRYILSHRVEYLNKEELSGQIRDSNAPIAILIQREQVGFNIWHALMEFFSMYLTLDTLRMTVDPATGHPFLGSADFDNTQVVILDEGVDGPYFHLWKLFARKPVLRWHEIATEDAPVVFKKIITPLSGRSNPFWRGNSTNLECHNSTLLRAFSQRVLYASDIPLGISGAPPPNRPIQLTWIDRKTDRRLLRAEQLLSLVRVKYPEALLTIHIIDYAEISFTEQLGVTYENTDILVGVHGAGLTHTMFLKPGSAVVEIMPFGNEENPGFHNIANAIEDVAYYRGVTVDNLKKTNAKGDWQHDDVWMEDRDFVQLISSAVDDIWMKRGMV